MKIRKERLFTMDEIRDIVRHSISGRDIEKVILFGSYARGDATEKSDVDLMVYGGETLSTQSFFSFCGQLYMTSNAFKDVFDADSLSSDSPWKHQILQEGVIIYEK